MGFVYSEEVEILKADMKTLQATLEAVKERDEGELKTIREEIEKEVHKKSGTEELKAEIAQLLKDMTAVKKDLADAKTVTLSEKEHSRKMELTNEIRAIG